MQRIWKQCRQRRLDFEKVIGPFSREYRNFLDPKYSAIPSVFFVDYFAAVVIVFGVLSVCYKTRSRESVSAKPGEPIETYWLLCDLALFFFHLFLPFSPIFLTSDRSLPISLLSLSFSIILLYFLDAERACAVLSLIVTVYSLVLTFSHPTQNTRRPLQPRWCEQTSIQWIRAPSPWTLIYRQPCRWLLVRKIQVSSLHSPDQLLFFHVSCTILVMER